MAVISHASNKTCTAVRRAALLIEVSILDVLVWHTIRGFISYSTSILITLSKVATLGFTVLGAFCCSDASGLDNPHTEGLQQNKLFIPHKCHPKY